jgi:CBS domain-containing protein
MSDVTARQIMTPDPESTSSDVTVLSAAAKMSELDIRHLPVVDRENRLIGMLSDRDVREAIGDPSVVIGEDRLDDGILVAEAMRETPVRLGLDANLDEIANVFTDERVGAIVIVDEDDHPAGILSYVDLIAWFMRNRERARPSSQSRLPNSSDGS